MGCRKILGTYTFSRIYLPIELRCGDIIMDEVNEIRKTILCSECQAKKDSEVGK